MSIPFVTLDDAHYGEAVQVSPLIQRVVAKNPSKFSYLGTGTYVIGGDDVAVIDPGPNLDSHRDALIAALDGRTVRAILVTHCHSDHSPLAAWLHEYTGAPRVAYGPHVFDTSWVDDGDAGLFPESEAAEREERAKRAEEAKANGELEEPKLEEPADMAFVPDVRVVDGDLAAEGPGWTMRALYTPGHTSNHTAFTLEEEQALFTGDHIMGWSTTVITPADGDMRAYFDSLEKVRARRDRTFWPTHGAPITDTVPFVDAFVEHRLERERQVLDAVRSGVGDIPGMVRRLYVGVHVILYRAAARSVLSHLVKLQQDGLVAVDGDPTGRCGLRSHYVPV